jgi:hypothetical protein
VDELNGQDPGAEAAAAEDPNKQLFFCFRSGFDPPKVDD